VSFYQLPPVSITVNGDTMRVYNTVTCQWYLNGVAIPGATSHIYIATVSGDYQVAVTDSNGCGATSNPVNLALGFSKIELDKVQVYPNPLNAGTWQLRINNELLGSQVEIFDASGKVVFKSEITHTDSEIGNNLASGIYFLRINSAGGILTKKLVRL
jgi:hypothetical protein